MLVAIFTLVGYFFVQDAPLDLNYLYREQFALLDVLGELEGL